MKLKERGKIVGKNIYKILVTGGAGFIGSNLVDMLIKEGHEVVVLDNFSTGNREYVNKQARVYDIDVTDSEIFRVFRREKFDVVFHLAGQSDIQKSISEPLEDGDVNILGTINVAKNCGEYEVKKLVYVSTTNVYDKTESVIRENSRINPESSNAISNYAAELYVKQIASEYGFEHCILRCSSVYGVRQSDRGDGGIVKMTIDKLKKKSVPIMFGEGDLKRDFIFVIDAVTAMVKALDEGVHGVYNIASGVGVEQEQFLSLIIKKFNSMSNLFKSDMRAGECYYSNIDISKAQRDLDWSPMFNIEEGIEITVQYENQVAK